MCTERGKHGDSCSSTGSMWPVLGRAFMHGMGLKGAQRNRAFEVATVPDETFPPRAPPRASLRGKHPERAVSR